MERATRTLLRRCRIDKKLSVNGRGFRDCQTERINELGSEVAPGKDKFLPETFDVWSRPWHNCLRNRRMTRFREQFSGIIGASEGDSTRSDLQKLLSKLHLVPAYTSTRCAGRVTAFTKSEQLSLRAMRQRRHKTYQETVS